MKTVDKVINNLINKNIFPLNAQPIKARWVIFGDN